MSDGMSKPTQDTLEGVLSIGDLAKATGIRPDTIRSWERKFGLPVPIRLPSGHRRYTEDHVRWLRRVAEALARGHRASVAVNASEEELAKLLDDPQEAPDPEYERILDWMRAYDRPALSDYFHRVWRPLQPLALLDRVTELARVVGRYWADGHVDIRHEHFLTALLGDLLRRCREDYPVSERDPIAVISSLPGEKHALGLQMSAIVFAWKRYNPYLLGTETPISEMIRSAQELDAAALAVGVSLATGGVDTDRAIRELRLGLPNSIALLVGGAGARRGRWGARGAIYPKDVAALATWLEEHRRDRQ